MRRYVLAVSLAHLVLLPAYVKLGAINPWQAVGSVFGSGHLWTVMLLSAAAAPFLLGAVGWTIDSLLRGRSNRWFRRVRESAFVFLGIAAALSLTNALLLANRSIERDFRVQLVVFVNSHLLVMATLAVIVAVAIITVCLASTAIRQRSVRFLRGALYILAPGVLLSVFGIFYVMAVATPLESTGEPPKANSQLSPAPGLPRSVVVLLFDGFSYASAFDEGEVDERLPNLRALADQSLVFHNVPSYSRYTVENVPVILTGQVYDSFEFDSEVQDAAYLPDGNLVALRDQKNIFDLFHEQNYRLEVLGYFLRYCSTYVKDTGYCESTSADELNSQPYSLTQAFLEIYRLAAAKTLPTSVGYKLESLVGATFLSLIEDRVLGLQDSLLPRLGDADGRFLYAHYPTPHLPYVRLDPQTRRLKAANATYFDSLQAVDFFLGEIRQALQNSGMWEDTLLVVLSDHYSIEDPSDERTLLIIKFPRMKERIDFEGLWTHAQFLPLMEELIQRRSFDPDTVLTVVEALAPPG